MSECGCVLNGVIIHGKPFVSVYVITYNHGKYIKQCLDGILMQNVNFPYEVLIHDDASPDDTADIIREYEAKYPGVIKPIYQTVNQYSKVGDIIGRIQNGRALGKYIAHCEGDDYWTDPRKLQMQVDFLEEHEEYVGTAHNVRVINENNEDIEFAYFAPFNEYVYTLKFYDKTGKIPSQLASWVYRNIFSSLSPDTTKEYYSCKANGDMKLALLLALCGDIYCFKDYMSVYRNIRTSGTSWNARVYGTNRSHESQLQYINMHNFAKSMFNVDMNGFQIMASPSIISPILFLIKYPNKQNLNILVQTIKFSPKKLTMILNTFYDFLICLNKKIKINNHITS